MSEDVKSDLSENERGILSPDAEGGTAAYLSLHTRRPWFMRLDLAPFFVCYALLLYMHFFCIPEGGTRYTLDLFKTKDSNGSLPTNGTSEVLVAETPITETTDEALNLSFYGFILLPLVVVTHVAFLFAGYWSISARCFFQYFPLANFDTKQRMYVRAIPREHSGAPKMCRVIDDGSRGAFFVFQQTKYVWDPPTFKPLEYPTKLSLSTYKASKGLVGGYLSRAKTTYPPNEFNIPLPKFQELFKEHALAPFFLFQVFCVGLWCLDEYWYYSLITLVMLFIFEKQVVNRRIDNLQKLRNMRMPPYNAWVYRRESWVRVSTQDLRPGDVIELTPSVGQTACPCDCLLLAGTCVVNEAMLTGESVPQVKEAISDEDTILDIEKTHKRNVVFGGTRIILSDLPKGASRIKPRSAKEKGCIAYVLRTGFGTSQGNLVRTILFSTERVSVNNTESLLFILFLVVFAVMASAYVLVKGLEDESRSRYKLILNCIMIVTSVVPPELPMELSLAVNTSLFALFKNDIFCTEPFRIPLAGAVDICCFDKTGTLTSDRFNVLGVSNPSTRDPEILDPWNLSPEQCIVLAGCHSLVYMQDRGLLGDPMEIASFQAIGWSMNKNQVASCRGEAIKVETKFPFSSALQRMATVIAVQSTNEYWITAKGSPEMMASRFASPPDCYHDTHKHFSSQGCRVLALGYRRIGRISESRRIARNITREQAEKDLQFAGFLILHCPLKKHSLDTVHHLNSSTHKIVMITGDHVLTACHVAHKLGISTKNYPSHTLMLDRKDTDTKQDMKSVEYRWVSIDEKTTEPLSVDAMKLLVESYDLCVSGTFMEALQNKEGIDFVEKIIPHIKVFARFSPTQKEMVLTTLKKLGLTTLMCGDGTNDVGALKQAHVGVALITREVLGPQRAFERKAPAKIQASRASDVRSHTKGSSIPRSRGRRQPSRPQRAPPPARAQARSSYEVQLAEMLENEEMGVVRLGDASIASPFTSKQPYVSSVIDIIRMGRCTLVTTYQMFRILALNCLVSAYSMSVLYLDGVKFGDTQMTIASLAITFFFFFISRSTPLKKLSAERPPSSLFNVSFFAEILGQFVIHMACLVTAVSWAMPYTPRDKETMDPDGEFKANVLNSVVFLVSTSMTVATFFANYRGPPFMVSLFENRLLLYSLVVTEGLLLLCALDFLSPLNRLMELAPLPDIEFRLKLTGLMIADLVIAFVYTAGVRRLL
ncbi:hypothetical protein AAMO2058_001233400 [Amorphochlora amoebiformis]|mmetsp:Transcript_8130/g.12650  ORF Transcript_8130/g.12650 Transcript_8130/m.12650 type:complete len:1219 (-) Transcript_8130:46-3702(-)